MRVAVLVFFASFFPNAGPAAGPDEQAALAVVARLKGRFERDEGRPTAPVVSVDLDHTGAGDANLAGLGGFRELRKLYLNGTQVTDAGLKHLTSLGHLQTLDLRSTKVSGPGLRNLAGLRELEVLYLSHSE